MIRTRYSGTSEENPRLRAMPARFHETNTQWLSRAGISSGILLLGGASLAHFRIRVAQSHLRADLMPSFWSAAGILRGDKVDTVQLEWPDASAIPPNNAVCEVPASQFDDPQWFPNIAVLRFAGDARALRGGIERVRRERSIVDLPRLVVAWLGFVWGAGEHGNPLLAGVGVPSAAFVDSAHGLAGVELTPGLSSDATCPEAIWLSAKWWQRYYRDTGAGKGLRLVPSGVYATRQRAGFVYDPTDRGETPPPRETTRGRARRAVARRRR